MILAERPRLRLASLCALFAIQGIPVGLVSIGLAAYLADQGATVADIAQLLAVSWLPWAFKAVYGPLVDRFSSSPMGRRRPWMLAAQTCMALMLAGMIAVPGLETRVFLLSLLIFIHNTFSALNDVAIDALAVDLLEPGERGRANGWMWSAKISGLALGGAGLGTLMTYTNLSVALSIQLALLLAGTLWILAVRERPGERRFPWSAGQAAEPSEAAAALAAPDGFRYLLAELYQAFRKPHAVVIGLLALLASLPTRMMVTLGPVFAVQQMGWEDASFTQFAGGPVLLAGIAGAVIGGRLADRYGYRTVLAVTAGGMFLLFNLFALAEPWWEVTALLVILLLGGVFLDMALRMALFTLFMHTARRTVAATQFAIYMALTNLCNVLGSAVIVPLDEYFDYRGIFLWAAGFAVITVVLLRWVPRRSEILPVPTPA